MSLNFICICILKVASFDPHVVPVSTVTACSMQFNRLLEMRIPSRPTHFRNFQSSNICFMKNSCTDTKPFIGLSENNTSLLIKVLYNYTGLVEGFSSWRYCRGARACEATSPIAPVLLYSLYMAQSVDKVIIFPVRVLS